MARMMDPLFGAFAAALLLILGGQPAKATSLHNANIVHMVDHAEQAFLGTVISVELVNLGDVWADEITVQVEDTLLAPKGGAAETVTWKQFRPTPNTRIPALPKYEPGQEIVVFLTKKAEGSAFQAPVGLNQGSFTVTRPKDGSSPQVGNRYQNSNLLKGVETEALAEAMAKQAPKAASAKGNLEAGLQAALQGRRQGPVRYAELKAMVTAIKQSGLAPEAFLAAQNDTADQPLLHMVGAEDGPEKEAEHGHQH